MKIDKDHSLWTERYRPDQLENYIGNDHLKEKIDRYLKTNDIPHLLLYGRAGTGKTTLAKLIIKNVDCDYLYINASDENNIETVRTKIKNFSSAAGFSSIKIIILDEADHLTTSAQAALRNIMETFSKHCTLMLVPSPVKVSA